ncbi:MAG: hypothetical protein COW32_02465 [Candidatus Aquicultor secundus]|uniref:Quinohemoprotein amine dehydrogenase alpha subunit haem binding domain-containing protein n=1 Tax=Candidatus Aquicultor secundus TaxID=1973895 RepID=A0A2M7TBR4_9ACTN|nr:hypothetical protein [Candidatus Aquicultor secundus]NCO65320.1 hypothetical protein [Solirubrobacter sp.]OIO86710.1 MAG: hypothetical protein AUK32_05090 [Candidatus Aquicultor secundus]PIU28016.1 MAG: hypothetical protein COT10_00430 [Candidatus Aquicultor secundus]PIW22831.1 MAG: hypothetical protein COW32_02465 [Candidatus Aquicultor secundus]PIX52725.1 MAG: hypothetical protein COZ51_02630 [Candidatus Aquicultor secundus]
MTSKKLISSFVFVCAVLVASSPLALAQDTSKIVYDRCTVCHNQSRWEGQKKTEKQWSSIVDKMVRWGAELTPEENDLVVNYLTAASNGKIKQPTTTTTVVRTPKPTSTTTDASKNSNIKAAKTTTTSDPSASTTTTTILPVTTTTLLKEQAKTGVEMIWYLLAGGSLIGSGLKLRNKDKQLNDD